MNESKSTSRAPERRYLSIRDAASKLNCSIDDLLHYGATGQAILAVMLKTGWDDFVEEFRWVDGKRLEGSQKYVEYAGIASVRGEDLVGAEVSGRFSCHLFGLPGDIWIEYRPWLDDVDEMKRKTSFRVDGLFVAKDELLRLQQHAVRIEKKPNASAEAKRLGTYLKIIAALCANSQIDPAAPKSAGDIAVMTRLFDVSVTDDTVRSVLRELPETKK